MSIWPHLVSKPSKSTEFGSKWRYAKDALSSVSENTLAQIVDDLELGTLSAMVASISPPSNWANTKDFRLFISHIAVHRDKATRLRECLESLRHQADLLRTKTSIRHPLWQTVIERALHCMDAMVTIHTAGFAQ